MLKFKWLRIIWWIYLAALIAVLVLIIVLPPEVGLLSRLLPGLIMVATGVSSILIIRRRFKCPKCGYKGLLKQSLISYRKGDVISCTKCGKSFVLE